MNEQKKKKRTKWKNEPYETIEKYIHHNFSHNQYFNT